MHWNKVNVNPLREASDPEGDSYTRVRFLSVFSLYSPKLVTKHHFIAEITMKKPSPFRVFLKLSTKRFLNKLL